MPGHGSQQTAAGALPVAAGTTARAIVLLAMCLGVLIAQVDTSVVNLATHSIGVAFYAGVAPLQWVLNVYNLVYVVLLLSGGLIADLHGRRRGFMIGAAAMTAGSLVCAFSPDIGVLIAGRACTGIGTALLLPASPAIIRVVWPDAAARGRALGVWASCNGLAFAIGPSLGGVLIDWFGWRSVFLLVVPLGAAALLLAWLAVPESAARRGRHFDLPGQLLGAVAVGGLAFAAIAFRDGGDRWHYALGLALLALPLFLVVERRAGPAALVPLDLFCARVQRRDRCHGNDDLRHLWHGLPGAAALAAGGAYRAAGSRSGFDAAVAGVLRCLDAVRQIGQMGRRACHDRWRHCHRRLRVADACHDQCGIIAVAGSGWPGIGWAWHGREHRPAAGDRGRRGGIGAFRHRIGTDQCGAHDRRDVGRRPAGDCCRGAARRRGGPARGNADWRGNPTMRGLGGLGDDPLSAPAAERTGR
jgi:MFS family permease